MNVRNWVKAKKNVLVCGESGVGKSYFVRKIAQELSKDIIQINVSNLSKELIESELFGHTKGSFSGASFERVGLCESIGDGVLFLDEIAEMPLSLQPKLLTLLEEGVYRKVGSNKVKKFNGSIVVATHQNLKEKVDEGKFRKDLYFRLNTFEFELSSLRENKDFKIILNSQIEMIKNKTFAPSLLSFLYSYDWPGNYRELNNVFEYFSFCEVSVLTKEHLPASIKEKKTSLKENVKNYYKSLELFEIDYFKSALEEDGFNISKCSKNIGISKVTLLSKIKKYDLSNYIKMNKSLRYI